MLLSVLMKIFLISSTFDKGALDKDTLLTTHVVAGRVGTRRERVDMLSVTERLATNVGAVIRAMLGPEASTGRLRREMDGFIGAALRLAVFSTVASESQLVGENAALVRLADLNISVTARGFDELTTSNRLLRTALLQTLWFASLDVFALLTSVLRDDLLACRTSDGGALGEQLRLTAH
jgi:hypothetical protein